jgi:dihydroxyacid dehydratase/phosphogluconate dehydratase
MVRIPDARMRGAADGTVVLHVATKAAAGGSLAVVREGDWIALNCDAGTLDLGISEQELAERMEALANRAPAPIVPTGLGWNRPGARLGAATVRLVLPIMTTVKTSTAPNRPMARPLAKSYRLIN